MKKIIAILTILFILLIFTGVARAANNWDVPTPPQLPANPEELNNPIPPKWNLP